MVSLTSFALVFSIALFCFSTPSLSSVLSTKKSARQAGTDDSSDGFTDQVNTGVGIFRPIRPGARVPAANQFPDRQAANMEDKTPEPSPMADDAVCFPGIATVELEDGRSKQMQDLHIGDVVRVSEGEYSPVFMFTHRLTTVMYGKFVQLVTASGHDITLTPSHYLHIKKAENAAKQMVTAGSVRVGDMLLLNNGGVSNVIRVNENVQLQGLYNPQTVHGDIVVDDIVASTYTKSLDLNTAHALLSPLRMLYEHIGLSLTCFDSGVGKISALFPSGSDQVQA